MSTNLRLNLLLAEDSPDDMTLIVRELKKAGYDVACTRVETRETLLAALAEQRWDVVISDFTMPRLTGLEALEIVKANSQDLPFFLVSGSVGEQLAVQAMKAGAHDYFMKDSLTRLASAVSREIQEASERKRRKEAELALEEKSKQLVVAQRMEAIGRLAGGIAHDLNNMIGACTLYAEMALNPKEDPESVRENVREIVRAQERATQLIRQLLAFSRKQVVDPQIISINDVIGHIHNMIGKILGEDIELVLDLDRELKCVKADTSQIDQVIMNLVVNARDAMPTGGRLEIKTRNEVLEAKHPLIQSEKDLVPGDYVCLSVADTGSGMSDAVRAKIFEPFFTTKEVGKGTGLGLATVYGIVKQAQGHIRVISEVGKGTTFDVFVRAVEGTGLASGTEENVVPRKRSVAPSLLLVEDDPSVQKALKEALSRNGYRLYVASSGEEALKLFSKHEGSIDLLVSDVVMPKMSGTELAKELRKQKPSLKILFLSGYSEEALAPHRIDRADTFVLAKPFNTGKLTRKIEEILGDGNG